MYGVNQETVSSEDIEKYSLTKEIQEKQMDDIKRFTGVKEVALLCTNLRNEYYLHVDETIFKHGDLLRYLADFTEKPLKEVILETYSKFNEDVICHLFSVACGMESKPMGTLEPLASTEEALILAREKGTVGFVLKDLFEQAIQYAERIHQLPEMDALNQGKVSQSIRYIREYLEECAGKQFVLFGEGYEVTQLTKSLLSWHAESITIANAHSSLSEQTVEEINPLINKESSLETRVLHAADLDNALYRLASADVIFVSSFVKHAWLSEDLLNQVKELRQTKKTQLILDLSDAQEEYLLAHQPQIDYVKIADIMQKEYSEEEKEQALTYFDESLLHATDHFMSNYQEFLGRKDSTSMFTKLVPEVGS
jgi:glutamyl-tRNA reductase